MSPYSILFRVVEVIAIVGGVIYAGVQANYAGTQAELAANRQLMNSTTMLLQVGNRIQDKIWNDDELLRAMYAPTEKIQNTDIITEIKKDLVIAMLINYHSVAFDISRTVSMPAGLWAKEKVEAAQFFQISTVKGRWDKLQQYHTDAFKEFVEKQTRRNLPRTKVDKP